MYAHMHSVRGTNSQIRDTRSLPRSLIPANDVRKDSERAKWLGSNLRSESRTPRRYGGAELGSCVMSSRL